jgi:hypothetical protein
MLPKTLFLSYASLVAGEVVLAFIETEPAKQA